MYKGLNLESFIDLDSDWDNDDFEERYRNIQIDKPLNATLAFVYVDHTAGLSVMILACGYTDSKGMIHVYKREKFDQLINARRNSIADFEFEFLNDTSIAGDFDLEYYKPYAQEMFEHYNDNDMIYALRIAKELDGFRDDDFPDDILVHFFKKGRKPEGMWLRYESFDGGLIEGVLLNQPHQDMGINEGDKVRAYIYKENEDADYICFCDLDQDAFIVK